MLKQLIIGAYFWLSDLYEEIVSPERMVQCSACERLYLSRGPFVCPRCSHDERFPVEK